MKEGVISSITALSRSKPISIYLLCENGLISSIPDNRSGECEEKVEQGGANRSIDLVSITRSWTSGKAGFCIQAFFGDDIMGARAKILRLVFIDTNLASRSVLVQALFLTAFCRPSWSADTVSIQPGSSYRFVEITTDAGPREIIMGGDGYGMISNRWFCASVAPGPRYTFWNDSARKYAEFDAMPVRQISGFRNTLSPNRLLLYAGDPTAPKEPVLMETPVSPWLSKGEAMWLGQNCKKYQRLHGRRSGYQYVKEVWLIKQAHLSHMSRFYRDLFMDDLPPNCLPLRVFSVVMKNSKELKRTVVGEVKRIEKTIKTIPKPFFEKARYRKVSDLFDALVGEDGSEMEFMFQKR